MNIQLCTVNDYIAIESLEMHPDNPRTIRPERLKELKESIVEKGFYQPILVWADKNVVLSGNHRLMAVKELIEEGYSFHHPSSNKGNYLPVVLEEVEPEMAEAILYESNNQYAEWVQDRLTKALEDAETAGRKLSMYGFTSENINLMLKNAVEDANSKVDHGTAERGLPTPTAADIEDSMDDEEFESLVLSRPQYVRFTAILARLSEEHVEDWKEGDMFNEVIDLISDRLEQEGLEPEPKAKKKKKKSH